MTKEPLSMYLPTAIRQAVEDLKELREQPGFAVNTSQWVLEWHTESGAAVCHICVAGAAIVSRLTHGVSDGRHCPCDFPAEVAAILRDINDTRDGSMCFSGLETMIFKGPPPASFQHSLACWPHEDDYTFDALCAGMLERAAWLEANAIQTNQ